MARDIFEFWSEIEPGECVHPEDRKVMDRVGHNFEIDCLPSAFIGPLFSARVVLLLLSPGYTVFDREHARTDAGIEYYCRQYGGRAPLPTPEDHEPAYNWWSAIVRQFRLEPKEAADKIAVLNIGAYHSEHFQDWHMLTTLPSSRVSLDWTHGELFPQAEAGKKVVVCLRSARLWGLARGERYGHSLFAPQVTPNGLMRHGPMRESATEVVQSAIRSG